MTTQCTGARLSAGRNRPDFPLPTVGHATGPLVGVADRGVGVIRAASAGRPSTLVTGARVSGLPGGPRGRVT